MRSYFYTGGRPAHRVMFAFLTAAIFILLVMPATASAKLENQFVLMAEFGHEVNLTQSNAHAGEEKEDVCEAKTSDVCQQGVLSFGPGGYESPFSVAVGPETAGKTIAIADTANSRMQILSSTGKFLLMAGWEVNQTTKANICTQADITGGDKCQAGRPSSGQAGELLEPNGITVDQATGDIYVYDLGDHRIVMYDPKGDFSWMVGGDVNKTKAELGGSSEAERNICTAVSGDVCQKGAEPAENAKARNAFRVVDGGNVVSVVEQSLYVGDQGRIQIINAVTGQWTGEITLAALHLPNGYVKALGVDKEGNVYVADGQQPASAGEGVSVLDPTGRLIGTIDRGGKVESLALDPFGRIAVTEVAEGSAQPTGLLFSVQTGDELSKFHTSFQSEGVAFNPDENESADELYAADGQMVQEFLALPVAEPATSPCIKSATSVTLIGTVDPKEVPKTRAWFLYGPSLKQETPRQLVATSSNAESVEATISGLHPNETYEYALAAEDENYEVAGGEEPLTGKTLVCETLYIPPVVAEEAQSYYVGFSSADLYGELNPENAHTTYRFQYGACGQQALDECADVHETPPLESAEYRTFGVMQTATDLQPATRYRYRLIAESENLKGTEQASGTGNEGEFTTLAAPSPSVFTGPVGSVTSSTAVLNGTVSGGGAAATYSFQVGVYDGSGTVYGTVITGAAPSEGAAGVSYLLTGLQGGTTYAYRVTVSSPYIQNPTHTIVGEPVLFTTGAAPPVIAPPSPVQLLPNPAIPFPRATNDSKAKKRPAKHKPHKTKGHKSKRAKGRR